MHIIFIVSLLFSLSVQANSEVTLSLEEYRQMYDRINAQDALIKQLREPDQQKINDARKAFSTIETVIYQLRVEDGQLFGNIELSGKTLRGAPTQFPVFKPNFSTTGILDVSGADLSLDDSGFYQLYSQENVPFNMHLSFVQNFETTEQGNFTMALPLIGAVQQTLYLELPDHIELVNSNMSSIAEGLYGIPVETAPQLEFRKKLISKDKNEQISIDSFSTIEVHQDYLLIESHFVPAQPINQPLRVKLADGSSNIASNLDQDRIEIDDDGNLTLRLKANWVTPFTLRYQLPLTELASIWQVPTIGGNYGNQGEFYILPEPGLSIEVNHPSLVSNIAASNLSHQVQAVVQQKDPYYRIVGGESVKLLIQRYTEVNKPDFILDELYFRVDITDSGKRRNTLTFVLPAQKQASQIILKAIPGADLWSLKVNGVMQPLYQQQGQDWILPVISNKQSSVELVYLEEMDKPGISGNMKITLPETHLAAEILYVSIILPKRLSLINIDTMLLPEDHTEIDNLPNHYSFQSPYYKGGTLSSSLYYAESANVGVGL